MVRIRIGAGCDTVHAAGRVQTVGLYRRDPHPTSLTLGHLQLKQGTTDQIKDLGSLHSPTAGEGNVLRQYGGHRGTAGHRSPPYGIGSTAPVGTALCRPRGTYPDARRTGANAEEAAGDGGAQVPALRNRNDCTRRDGTLPSARYAPGRPAHRGECGGNRGNGGAQVPALQDRIGCTRRAATCGPPRDTHPDAGCTGAHPERRNRGTVFWEIFYGFLKTLFFF